MTPPTRLPNHPANPESPASRYHVIARSEATHPRVASLAPSGQFTFWQSVLLPLPMGAADASHQRGYGLPRLRLAMTAIVDAFSFYSNNAVIQPARRGHAPALLFCFSNRKIRYGQIHSGFFNFNRPAGTPQHAKHISHCVSNISHAFGIYHFSAGEISPGEARS